MTQYLTRKEFRDFKNNDFRHLQKRLDKLFLFLLTTEATIIIGLLYIILTKK